MDVIDIIITITGILDLILSFVVLSRNRKSHINISFAIFSFFLGLWAFSITFFRVIDDSFFTFFWAKAIYISGSLIAASLLYFALSFPEGKPLSRKTTLLIIIPSVIHTLLIAWPPYLTHSIVQRDWGKEVILGKVEYAIFSAYFISFFYGALFFLWKKYKKFSGRTKTQILFIFVSILIAGFIASIFDLILPGLGNYRLIYIGPAFSGIIFWLITYAIVRHQLWDFKLVLARSIAYTILVLWLGSLYTTAVFWISRSFFTGSVDNNQILVYTILALFVAFTVQPLKQLIEKTTDDIFFRYNYDSNDLLFRLSKIMATTLDLQELAQKTLHELLNTIHIVHGVMYVSHDKTTYQPAAEGVINQHIPSMDLVTWFCSFRKTLIYDEEVDEKVKEQMHIYNISVAIPLYVNDNPHGLLVLGDKKSGDFYSEKDLDVLSIFSPELAVAIENAKSYAEIRSFNITLADEVAKATEDLETANEQLKQLDKMKDEFVSLASHELRTPMTAIKSYLWFLLDQSKTKFDAKEQQYIEHAYNATDRLIALVNDMLNVSRIESGRMILNKKLINLVPLAEEIIAELLPVAKKLQIQLTFDKPSTLIPNVFADGNKMREVLINLIGNSLKFTPPRGSVHIAISVDEKDITTAVRDTGKGIKQEETALLFKKFGTIGEITQKEGMQSTGLGLYITKAIIEMHNGKIWAESDGEGKGAVFSFQLPVMNDTHTDVTLINNASPH